LSFVLSPVLSLVPELLPAPLRVLPLLFTLRLDLESAATTISSLLSFVNVWILSGHPYVNSCSVSVKADHEFSRKIIV
ncbi:MAG: hypothetical protein MI741_22960, partial [Rhodospirillales bacterium]|nr:hypothetical protein [Rhodospirillales bacterium]